MTVNAPFLCMGIARCLGMLGFFGCAGAVFHFGRLHWGIPPIGDFSALMAAGAHAWRLAAFSLFAGLIGLAIGQGIGAAVRVRDNDAALRLNVLWHCAANGTMLWIAYTGSLISLTLGSRDAVRAFAASQGTACLLSSGSIGLAGAAAIGLMVGELLVRSRRRDGSGEKLMLILPFLTGLPMGIAVAVIWNLPLAGAMAAGFFFPESVTVFSGGLWQRDQDTRKRLPVVPA